MSPSTAPGDARFSLGPLGPLLRFTALLMALFTAARVALYLAYADRLLAVEGSAWCFLVGLRMDSITVSYLLVAPVLWTLLTPGTWRRVAAPGVALYLAAWAAVAVHLEVATFPFVAQYDTRPNRLFFEYLVHPREVLGLLLSEYKLALAVAISLTVATFVAAYRWARGALEEAPEWGWGRRVAALPVAVVLLFLGARSSLRHRGANLSTAMFSGDHLSNQCALNSVYSLGYAIYSLRHETDPSRFYGEMPVDEVVRRVRKYTGARPEAYAVPGRPLHHLQEARVSVTRPRNLVVFIQESLGAEYVSCLGGKPLTPELCELADEGVLFTQLYATGTRTVRGLEAVASGFLPTPGRSVVKLGASQQGFYTVAQTLRARGYRTGFFYGGESHFDNMRSFLLGNGFEQAWDETVFQNPVFHGNWGVSDEDLARETNAALKGFGDQPFFALMLSTSNHSPFDYPAGRIELYEEPAATVHNAIKYADYAIGEFFRLARREEYFQDTVFLVVADHDTRVYGSDLVPVRKFRIPGVLLGPGIPQGVRFDELASQVDLVPTLLGVLGVEAVHPVPGRDLLAGDGTPGRAVMQFGQTHAFRVGDHVVVHQPEVAAQHFRYVGDRLEPCEADPELERDALAHAVAPGILYRDRLYDLAPAGGGAAPAPSLLTSE